MINWFDQVKFDQVISFPCIAHCVLFHAFSFFYDFLSWNGLGIRATHRCQLRTTKCKSNKSKKSCKNKILEKMLLDLRALNFFFSWSTDISDDFSYETKRGENLWQKKGFFHLAWNNLFETVKPKMLKFDPHKTTTFDWSIK